MIKDDNAKMRSAQKLTGLSVQGDELGKSLLLHEAGVLMSNHIAQYAESIVNTIRESLLVLDADLKIIFANRNFYHVFKTIPCETIGRYIYDVGDSQWDIPRLRELLENILPEHEAFDDYEVVSEFMDIGLKAMLLNARRIYGQDGNTWMILLAIEDITERRHLEDILVESEERFRRLFETANDGIVLLEKQEGKIVEFNTATEKLLGYTNQESIGQKLPDIGVDLDLDDFPATMQNLNMSGILKYDDMTVINKDGHPIDADIYLVDRAALVQCNIRDVTERKQALDELQRSEARLKGMVERLRKAFSAIIQVMVSAVEMRDPYTSGHQHRSADLARAIAIEMGLSLEAIESISMAGPIHDIGKMSVPSELLSKPTTLSLNEFALIKEHAYGGYVVLKDVESPWPLAEIVYQHHERMDGSGYPRSLKGDEILMEARILAVADVVESMASHRPYRPSLGLAAALEEIETQHGILYDTPVVDACLRLFREKEYQLEGMENCV